MITNESKREFARRIMYQCVSCKHVMYEALMRDGGKRCTMCGGEVKRYKDGKRKVETK